METLGCCLIDRPILSRSQAQTSGDSLAWLSPVLWVHTSASAPVARQQPLRVGTVGRLDRWKGQHLFLEAFAKGVPEWAGGSSRRRRVAVRENGYKLELERQVTDLALEGRVNFRGLRNNVEDEFLRLDVLVHASIIPEPFGQVVVEGMAAGLPVVAADAGGPAEVIPDGVDGLLYLPGDADALSKPFGDWPPTRPCADGSAMQPGCGPKTSHPTASPRK